MARVNAFMMPGGMSGKTGNAVFVTMADGRVYLRQRVTPRDPQTSKQQESRRLLTLASRAFKSLTLEEYRLWEQYAWRQGVARPNDVFVPLAYKLLQIDPEASVPRTPPTSAFAGDSVVVTVDPLAFSMIVRKGEGAGGEGRESSPMSSGTLIPNPFSLAAQGIRQGEGASGITFTADRPNGVGVLTELLLQPVPAIFSRPAMDKFRHRAFVAFEDGHLSESVAAVPGVYSAAVRFVRAATGQVSALVLLGNVRVD